MGRGSLRIGRRRGTSNDGSARILDGLYFEQPRTNPGSPASSTSFHVLNRLIGSLLLLVLLIMGSTSLFSLAKEIHAVEPARIVDSLTMTQEERIARGLARCERRLEAPEGREYWLYCALRDHSEPESHVFVLCPDSHRALSVQAHMRVLLHPRTIWLLDRLPDDWQTKARALGSPVYIVDYGMDRPLALHDDGALVLSRDDVRLWRSGKGGDR